MERDFLWFKVPRPAGWGDEAQLVIRKDKHLVILPTFPDLLRIGYNLPKHGFTEIRKRGFEAFIADLIRAANYAVVRARNRVHQRCVIANDGVGKIEFPHDRHLAAVWFHFQIGYEFAGADPRAVENQIEVRIDIFEAVETNSAGERNAATPETRS